MGYDIKKIVDTKSKIAVLMGGPSSEAEVSRRSGRNVFASLQRLGYENAQLIEVDENVAKTLREGCFEYVYNAMHGKFGEDGCLQGMLEVMGVPYTGCGVMASSVCMNKEYTKNILKEAGIPLIKSVLVKKDEAFEDKIKGLKYPLMLKPVCEGSSIGMFKVNTPEEMAECFKKSAECGQDIMVEEYVTGKSLTVGVLEDTTGEITGTKGAIFATEILGFRTKTEWYDFEAKYTAGMTEFILPADLSPEMTEKVKKIAINAFNACDCKGVSRVDFMVEIDESEKEGEAFVLEINTSPGMTDLSDLPAQSAAMGITYDNLVQIVLNGASLKQ